MRLSKDAGDKINPNMIGLFFEDINFAADGGLYAEMIENRSFEAKEAYGTPGNFYTVDDPGYAWSPVGKARLQYISGAPLSEANPHYLRLTAALAGDGVKNKAYDGLCLRKGLKYKVSFYARCVRYEADHFLITAVKDGKNYGRAAVDVTKAAPYMPFADTAMVAAMAGQREAGEKNAPGAEENADPKAAAYMAGFVAAIQADDGRHSRQADWVRCEGQLTATDDVRGAAFALTLETAGIVELDLISLIPEDAVAGIFRKDLFDALYDMHPGFIRFPGGCIVEGVSLSNRYRWKRTVGPVEDRTVIPCLWAFDDERGHAADMDAKRETSQAHYMQSYGIGFYEYFLLCELLGAKPLPVLNMGAACQFRSTEMVSSDSPAFGEYVQDALDLIEFANGAADSKWGSLRASMGHETPFGLEMLAIGNEQWETKYFDGVNRYSIFERKIHDRYPDMKLLGTAGPMAEGPLAQIAWDHYRSGQSQKEDYCYAVDEHYYVAPEWLYDKIDFYNDYPRDVAVFAGEYAAHDANKENSLTAALAEAAFLTGVEKNAGVVKLASYAPLFNRIGYSQWHPDMIWFDDRDVCLTPSYYVQKLYATNLGQTTVPMGGQDVALRDHRIYVSVTRTGGEYIIKAVNAGENPYELVLEDEEGKKVCDERAGRQILTADDGETGAKESREAKRPEIRCGLTMPQAVRLIETEEAVDGSLTLPAQSFTVLRINGQLQTKGEKQ